jgi:hypothetical protein
MLESWPARNLSAICDSALGRLRGSKLVTVAGSEPLLAEAGRELLDSSKENPVRHLADNSYLNCVDRGLRGKLVATLLIVRGRAPLC